MGRCARRARLCRQHLRLVCDRLSPFTTPHRGPLTYFLCTARSALRVPWRLSSRRAATCTAGRASCATRATRPALQHSVRCVVPLCVLLRAAPCASSRRSRARPAPSSPSPSSAEHQDARPPTLRKLLIARVATMWSCCPLQRASPTVSATAQQRASLRATRSRVTAQAWHGGSSRSSAPRHASAQARAMRKRSSLCTLQWPLHRTN